LVRAQAELGGVAFSEEQRAGARIIRRALEEPLRQIAQNAGSDGAVVVERVRAGKDDFGFDAASGAYGNLIAMGVVDPAKVVRSALENAASVAGMMLTTECMIAAVGDE
jgi:chaperonin GroEL